jgi:hypothetical protein
VGFKELSIVSGTLDTSYRKTTDWLLQRQMGTLVCWVPLACLGI